MKKYLSVLLATALVMAATTAFAAGEKTSLTLANTQPDTDIESQQLYACEDGSPAVYAFAKQQGIFISGIPSYFIRLQ